MVHLEGSLDDAQGSSKGKFCSRAKKRSRADTGRMQLHTFFFKFRISDKNIFSNLECLTKTYFQN